MSESDARVKEAFHRAREILAARPDAGIGTAVTTVRRVSGLTLAVEDGPWKLTVDMAEKAGGAGEGPNPGVLGRAALGSCLTIVYTTFAAAHDIPLDGIEVEVQADYNARGQYGVGDHDPGYTEIRYHVRIDSPASEATILDMMARAEDCCPYLWIFRDPQNLKRTTVINGSAVEAA